MTDLLSRPGARDSHTHQAPGPKPVVLSAVVAAGACLLTGVLACSVVAVIGWLAATAGGASGAVRAGTVAWLVAHKAPVAVGPATFGLAPLGLTVLAGLCLYRGGRFAARISEADRTRELITSAVALAVSYGAGAAGVALIASGGAVRVSPVPALLGAGTLALLAGTTGILVESGAAADLADVTPDWVRDAVPAALAATAAVLAVATLTFAAAMVAHFSRSAAMLSALDPGPVGAAVLFTICLTLLPNAVMYAVAFLAGPGFQLGTGTAVAPTGVVLGDLPAFPLLAAAPADGASPGYLLVLTAVTPVLAGVLAGLVVGRRAAAAPNGGVAGWDGLAVRAGLAAAASAALLLGLMMLAGGSAGPGRMADFGVPAALPAAGALAVGMMLGAVPAAVLGGRRRPLSGTHPSGPSPA